jgi:ribosomal protein S18 acetylase RimI-like enzyme
MSGAVVIAEARGPGDLEHVRDLCNGFLDWARSHYGEKRWIVDRYYTAEQWRAVLAALPQTCGPPAGEMLLGWIDGRPVGCVMMQKIEDDICEMKRLFVRPEGQGHGVGRKLCKRLMSIAAERGYRTMRLDTGINHDQALALYRSVGFRVRGPYYDPPQEIMSHLVFMEADLGAAA